MIVFYTFDVPENQNQSNSVLMLSLSIYTVLRELGSAVDEIIIYSNHSGYLRTKLKIKEKRIVFKRIDKRFSKRIENSKLLFRFDGGFHDENEHFRKIGGAFGTAHARVYLFEKIFKTYRKDILYLDYDTGIAKGGGEMAIDRMRHATFLTEPLTSYGVVQDILSIYPKIDKKDVPSYVNSYACRWNCGIVYIAHKEQNYKLLHDIKTFYFKLNRDFGFMQSADEWAIGLALFKNNRKPESTFKDSSFFVPGSQAFLHRDFDFATSPFIHYMDQKNLESDNIHWKEMLRIWNDFFDGLKEEPNFELWDYSNKKSNEYLWGRLELL